MVYKSYINNFKQKNTQNIKNIKKSLNKLLSEYFLLKNYKNGKLPDFQNLENFEFFRGHDKHSVRYQGAILREWEFENVKDIFRPTLDEFKNFQTYEMPESSIQITPRAENTYQDINIDRLIKQQKKNNEEEPKKTIKYKKREYTKLLEKIKKRENFIKYKRFLHNNISNNLTYTKLLFEPIKIYMGIVNNDKIVNKEKIQSNFLEVKFFFIKEIFTNF